MDKVYKGEHHYMSIWVGSFDNETRSKLYAYDDKGKKEFGEMGYKFIQRFSCFCNIFNRFQPI